MKSLYAALLLVAAVRADWYWDPYLEDWVDDGAYTWDYEYTDWGSNDWDSWGYNEGPLTVSTTGIPVYNITEGAAVDPFNNTAKVTGVPISLTFLGNSTSPQYTLVPTSNFLCGTTNLTIAGQAATPTASSTRRLAVQYVPKVAGSPPVWWIKQHPQSASYYQIQYTGPDLATLRTSLGVSPTTTLCLTIGTPQGSNTVPKSFFDAGKCRSQYKYTDRKKKAGVYEQLGNYMVSLSSACSLAVLTAWQVAGLCDGATDGDYLINCPAGSTGLDRKAGSFALAPVHSGTRRYIGVNRGWKGFTDYLNNNTMVSYLQSAYIAARNTTINNGTGLHGYNPGPWVGLPQEPTTNAIWRYRNVAFTLT